MQYLDAVGFFYSWTRGFLEFIPATLKNKDLVVEKETRYTTTKNHLAFLETPKIVITMKGYCKEFSSDGKVVVQAEIAEDHLVKDNYRIVISVKSDIKKMLDKVSKMDFPSEEIDSLKNRIATSGDQSSWEFDEYTPFKDSYTMGDTTRFNGVNHGQIGSILVENPRAMSVIIEIIYDYLDFYIANETENNNDLNYFEEIVKSQVKDIFKVGSTQSIRVRAISDDFAFDRIGNQKFHQKIQVLDIWPNTVIAEFDVEKLRAIEEANGDHCATRSLVEKVVHQVLLDKSKER